MISAEVKRESGIGNKLANGHDESTQNEEVVSKLSSKEHQIKKILKKDQKQEKEQENNSQIKSESKDKEENIDMRKDSKVHHKKNREGAEKEDTVANHDNNQVDEELNGVDSNGNPLVEDDSKEDTLEGTFHFTNIFYLI